MTVGEDIRLDHHVFADRPFDRIAASVDFRRHTLDNDPMSPLHSHHPLRSPTSDSDSHELRPVSALPRRPHEAPPSAHLASHSQTYHEPRCAIFCPFPLFSDAIAPPKGPLQRSVRLNRLRWPVPT